MNKIVIVFLLFSFTTFAKKVDVELKTGKVFTGQIISENVQFFILDIKGTNISLSKKMIVSIDGVPYKRKRQKQNPDLNKEEPASTIPSSGGKDPQYTPSVYTAGEMLMSADTKVDGSDQESIQMHSTISSPNVGDRVTIRMKNGSVVQGKIAEQTKMVYVINTTGRQVYCTKSNIVELYPGYVDLSEKSPQTTPVIIEESKSSFENIEKKENYKWDSSVSDYSPDVLDKDTTNVIGTDASTCKKAVLKELKRRQINSVYIYANFFSGGLSICNISDEYSDLLGGYHGAVLYRMLGGLYRVDPSSKLRASGNLFMTLGVYPKSFFGINTGFGYMVKGDKVSLIKEGYEEINSEVIVKYLEMPFFIRFKTPADYLAGYFDIGFSHGWAISGNEKMIYEYNNPGDNDYESEDLVDVDLFDSSNKSYYSKNNFSWVIAMGVHIYCLFIEYRGFFGLNGLVKKNNPADLSVESKFRTHTFNMGFDYYFRVNKKR